MEHFKVKAMPRLQLITCKITSLFFFSKSDTAEPPVTKSGAAAGTQVKGLLCADRNKDGSGLLMKPFQKEKSGYMNSIENHTLYTVWNAEAFSNLGHRSLMLEAFHEIFSCKFWPIASKQEMFFFFLSFFDQQDMIIICCCKLCIIIIWGVFSTTMLVLKEYYGSSSWHCYRNTQPQ